MAAIRFVGAHPTSGLLQRQAAQVQADMIAWADKRFSEATSASIQGKLGYLASYAVRSDAVAVRRTAELITELAKLSK